MWWTTLIALWPGTALAQDCARSDLDVLAVSPEPGSVDIPRDAQVVLQLRGAGDFDTLGARLTDGLGQPVDGSWTLEWTSVQTGLATFRPEGPLAPQTEYLVELDEEPEASTDAAESWVAGFTTSNAMSEGVRGLPDLSLRSVGQAVSGAESRCEPEVFRRVEVDVEPAVSERSSGEWVLVVQRPNQASDAVEDVLLAARRVDGRNWNDPLEVLVPSSEESFCLVGVHRDLAGQESETAPVCWVRPQLSDEDQVAYYGGGRCSTVGWGSLSGWPLIIGISLFRRQRSSNIRLNLLARRRAMDGLARAR